MSKFSVISEKLAISWDTTLIPAISMNYTVLDKDTIKNQILLHLPVAKRGFITKACIIEIINAIYLTDRQGLPLAMSEPMKGNHNDVYEIKQSLTEIFSTIESTPEFPSTGFLIMQMRDSIMLIFRIVCERHRVIANVCENPKYNH